MKGITVSIVVVVVAFVGAINARLCTPDEWEGHLHIHTSYLQNEKTHFADNHVTIGYNVTHKSKVFNMKVASEKGATNISYLIQYDDLHGQLKLYWSYPDKKSCYVAESKQGAVQEFPEACLPGDAKSAGDAHLGILGKNGVNVTDYAFKIGQSRDVPAVVTVTYPDDHHIFPIHASHNGGSPYEFVDRVFYNTSLGIKDSSIFDIPQSCLDHPKKIPYSSMAKFSIFTLWSY